MARVKSRETSHRRRPLPTSCCRRLKKELVGRECFTAPLWLIYFFQICSSCFVVKCCGKLDGLAKQRWKFSLKQSVDGAHSRGKLCKSLHWFGAKPSWPLEYISRLAMEPCASSSLSSAAWSYSRPMPPAVAHSCMAPQTQSLDNTGRWAVVSSKTQLKLNAFTRLVCCKSLWPVCEYPENWDWIL